MPPLRVHFDQNCMNALHTDEELEAIQALHDDGVIVLVANVRNRLELRRPEDDGPGRRRRRLRLREFEETDEFFRLDASGLGEALLDEDALGLHLRDVWDMVFPKQAFPGGGNVFEPGQNDLYDVMHIINAHEQGADVLLTNDKAILRARDSLRRDLGYKPSIETPTELLARFPSAQNKTMTTTHDIVAKLWNLCNVLRDDGITYHQYVTELTYLLFLKMAKETETERVLPEGYRWDDVVSKDGVEQLDFYRVLLVKLGSESSERVQAIFASASTSLTRPRNLKKLVESIDALDWYSAREEGLGDLYEGLLEKNANEKKSGAGQYFTPRPLIECMVRLVKPKAGELVQDPAAGTAGFLICADSYVKDRTDKLFDLPTEQQEFQRHHAFYGMELVQDAHRLALMNAMLHDIEGPILLGNTLGPRGAKLPKADVILTNPPFGTKKGGGGPTRDDLTFPTSNKQLAFLQHIYRGLKPGGRAAVVLPDNVLFEEGVGQKIRADLMDKCDLHTILRLPTGIFYSQGVKTNVLFFTRGEKDKGNTKAVWYYDMRANMPSFGKRTPLTTEHFADFETCFGDDPLGKSKRKDQGENGRFRRFTREDIAKRGHNLDISWLRDESENGGEELPEPDEIAAAIMTHLRTAMEEMEALQELLEPGETEVAS